MRKCNVTTCNEEAVAQLRFTRAAYRPEILVYCDDHAAFYEQTDQWVSTDPLPGHVRASVHLSILMGDKRYYGTCDE